MRVSLWRFLNAYFFCFITRLKDSCDVRWWHILCENLWRFLIAYLFYFVSSQGFNIHAMSSGGIFCVRVCGGF